MKVRAIFFLFVFGLTACTSTRPVDIQGTAIALAQTGVVLTQTAQPTTTPPPTVTPTATIVYPIPSSYPTQKPLPIFTPDVIQVERWKEYQTELAKLVLSEAGDVFPYYETALCEWDILGRSEQEVYVWATCFAPGSRDRKPAVIHLNVDGSIQKVEVPFHGSTWNSTIQRLFPVDVREKIDSYFSSFYSGRAEELRMHLQYRLTHPEIPPLVILSAISTP
ncbi:MAG: hypothetical protein HYZ25_18165 [Chloroflexi bacterium]|nr:hypothetical protein [Chloroflexota bacterium]